MQPDRALNDTTMMMMKISLSDVTCFFFLKVLNKNVWKLLKPRKHESAQKNLQTMRTSFATILPCRDFCTTGLLFHNALYLVYQNDKR